MIVPPSGNNPGGTYTQTITQTYVIQCINSTTKSSCNTNPPTPNNVVTGTGFGAYSPATNTFVVCNPVFTPSTNQSTSTASGTFENVATNFTSVDPNGNCVKGNPTNAGSACPTPAQVPGAACQSSGGGTGGGPPRYCNPCDGENDPNTCCSPVLVDTTGRGFELTDAQDGVKFDIGADGTPVQMAWTAAGSGVAFLVLPAADGLVHDGRQLFGSGSPQPPSQTPNGFAALAVYDDPKNGGNGNGVIDPGDAIYPLLRLWIDANHDGISQPEELHTLQSLGVTSISLDYSLSRRQDQYGNVFRFKTAIDPKSPDPDHVGRRAYDVFFRTLQPSAALTRMRKQCPAVTTMNGGMPSTGSR